MTSYPTRLRSRLQSFLFSALDRVIPFCQSNEPWLDPRHFPWTSILESNHEGIKREAGVILAKLNKLPNMQELDDKARMRVVNEDSNWKPFVLYAYGTSIEKNCAECPITSAALKEIPRLQNAVFSILLPNKRIAPHRGRHRGALRYHLGVTIPDVEKCGLKVGGTTRHWTEGGSLVFDDTYEHEAWNESDQIRVVLLIDFIRDLPFPISTINQLAFRMLNDSDSIKQVKQRATG